MGKTAFVLSMAKRMAVDYNIPVAMFSLEMSNVQLVNRLISNICEIEQSKIRSGRLTNKEWNNLELPITELIHEQELSIPCNQALTYDEVSYIIDLLNKFR
jgi:replicative DNA helicase